MSKQYKAPLGASLVVLSSVFYASYGIWTKLMGNFFGGYTASGLRSILVVLLLLPPAFVYHGFEPVRWRKNWRHLAGLLAGSLFIWGPLYYAILHAGVGISLTINYASIVIGMFFFGWLLNKERFTRDKLLATVLGFVGLACIFSPSTHGIGMLPLLASVLSGLSAAANAVIAKKISYNATQATIALWVTSAVASLAMALLIREPAPAVGWHMQWLYLLIFAAASVVASWSLVKGIKLIEAGAAGILGLLEIVFGVLFGVLFFHEHVSVLVMVGILTILAAAAIPYIKDYSDKKGTLGAE